MPIRAPLRSPNLCRVQVRALVQDDAFASTPEATCCPWSAGEGHWVQGLVARSTRACAAHAVTALCVACRPLHLPGAPPTTAGISAGTARLLPARAPAHLPGHPSRSTCGRTLRGDCSTPRPPGRSSVLGRSIVQPCTHSTLPSPFPHAGKMLLVVGLAGAEETAQHQLELLASFEAALRCAPGLQRRVPLTCAEFEVTETVAYSADWAVARCIRWAAQPDLQLTTDKAERLLAAAAALACTVCKCGVLHAAAEATAAAEADAAGAQHAAGSGAGPDVEAGAGAAGAPPPPTRPSAALTDLLPILAANCELLGEAVLLHADPSDRSHRWG